jgi:hypothetical protein
MEIGMANRLSNRERGGWDYFAVFEQGVTGRRELARRFHMGVWN